MSSVAPVRLKVRPCAVGRSPTEMTKRTLPHGYYARGSRQGFYPNFSFTLQEGGTYLDTDDRSGR